MDNKRMIDQLVTDGSVPLVTLTDEEMASVNADENTPFRPADAGERLRDLSPEARTAVLSTALRSLIARGLIEVPDGAEADADGRITARPVGEMETILAVRRAPAAVVFVGQASYLAALHGFRDERASGFLEERIDAHGLHHFTLRTVDDAVAAVAGRADPDGQAPATGPAPAVGPASDQIPAGVTDALRELGPGVTRLDAYHSRPAGTRRIQLSVLVRPGSAHVVSSAFGVAPEHPRLAAVNRDGLRRMVRDVLCDPAGDPGPGSEMETPDGPPYRCLVCGYLGLDDPPRSAEGYPSYEICDSCGYEYGGDGDDGRAATYAQARAEWIAGGMTWWSPLPRPASWDPRRQLSELTGPGPGAV
jgi:hypothetical protein